MDRYDKIEEAVLAYEPTIEAAVRAILDKVGKLDDMLLRSVTDSVIQSITSDIYDAESDEV